MSEDRIHQLLQLHKRYSDRIDFLDLRKAEMGPSFTSAQALELEQAVRDRDLVAAELHLLSPSPEARAVTSNEARWLLVEWRFQSLSQTVNTALRQFERRIVEYQDADADARRQSQWSLRVLLGLMLLLLLGLLLLQAAQVLR